VSKGDPARLFNLRCSQMPYCPRSVIVNYAIRGMFQAMDMRMAYYVAVGHAVHDVMQRYLALTGTLLADYTCRECGKKWPMSHKYECCDLPTKYDEIEIRFKGIVGHIDAVFKDRQGRYWIVDFKTCSISGASTKKTNPGQNYMRQVKAYAYLLWKQYGIKVHGVMLMFLPRDNPWEPTIWEYVLNDERYEGAKAELIRQRRIHKDTMNAKSLADFRTLFKEKCNGPYCDMCKREAKDLIEMVKSKIKKFPIIDQQVEVEVSNA
jgi:hypothetical protein